MTCIICGDARHNAHFCASNASVANDGSMIAKLQHEMWVMKDQIKFIEGTINALARLPEPDLQSAIDRTWNNLHADQLWEALKKAEIQLLGTTMVGAPLNIRRAHLDWALATLSERGAERVE